MQELMSYKDRKEDIRKRLRETAENFVYIGYQLKQVAASEGYRQDGYANIVEFAEKEYGLHRDDTYRFIRINSRYSVGGDSAELDGKYKGIAQTKLSEMLSLPDGDLGLITPETTRDDIRELKRFNAQDQGAVPDGEAGALEGLIMEFFRPTPTRPAKLVHRMYLEVSGILSGQTTDPVLTEEEQLQECLNPKGNSVFRTARYMLFLYEAVRGMGYKVFGENSPHTVSYLTFARTACLILEGKNQDAGLDPWENTYGTEPEEQPATPQDQEKPVKEPGREKPGQQDKPAQQTPKRPEPELEKPRQEKEEPAKETEKQPGQPNVDKPEGMPLTEESYPQKKPEKSPVAPALQKAPSEPKNEAAHKDQDLEPGVQMHIEDYPKVLPLGYSPQPRDEQEELFDNLLAEAMKVADTIREGLEAGREELTEDALEYLEERAKILADIIGHMREAGKSN